MIEGEKMKWVKTCDKLPKNNQLVICVPKENSKFIIALILAKFINGVFFALGTLDPDNGPYELKNIVYWIPIPDLPEEKNERT